MRKTSITEFLTHDEIAQAAKLYAELHATGTFARRCSEEIIAPVIERINKTLGQENDPKFLAYAVEYTFMHGPIFARPENE